MVSGRESFTPWEETTGRGEPRGGIWQDSRLLQTISFGGGNRHGSPSSIATTLSRRHRSRLSKCTHSTGAKYVCRSTTLPPPLAAPITLFFRLRCSWYSIYTSCTYFRSFSYSALSCARMMYGPSQMTGQNFMATSLRALLRGLCCW